MTFVIQDNMVAPASAARTRKLGEFATTLASLEVGQGFEYESNGTLKSQYPRIAPKKFGGAKRFKVWEVEGKEGVFAVRREEDRVVADANPGVNTVENDNDD